MCLWTNWFTALCLSLYPLANVIMLTLGNIHEAPPVANHASCLAGTSCKGLGFYWNRSQPLPFPPTPALLESAWKDTSSPLSLWVEKLLYTCQCKDVTYAIKTCTVHTSERPCLIPPTALWTKSTIHLFLFYYGNESVPILILMVFNIAFFANYRMPDPDFTVRDVKLLVGKLFWMHWIKSIQNRIALKYLSSCVCRHLW